MNDLFIYSIVGGLFSLSGGFLLLWNETITHRIITPLIAFGAGAFLGAAFLDILPEAIEGASEPHYIFMAVLTGFVLFFMLERLIMKFTGHKDKHNHSDHTESLPYLLILSDSIHNFLDGIVIALAYVANPVLGLTTTLAIVAHEIPQEIGDFAILMNMKWKRQKIILVNVLQSLLTIPGVLLGYLMSGFVEPYIMFFLAGASGIFIYIAASDLIPELHHRAGHAQFYRVVIPLIIGILSVYFLSQLAHGH